MQNKKVSDSQSVFSKTTKTSNTSQTSKTSKSRPSTRGRKYLTPTIKNDKLDDDEIGLTGVKPPSIDYVRKQNLKQFFMTEVDPNSYEKPTIISGKFSNSKQEVYIFF